MTRDEADAQRLHFLKWYRKSRQGFYCSQLDDQEIAAAGFYEGIHYAIATLTGSERPEGPTIKIVCKEPPFHEGDHR